MKNYLILLLGIVTAASSVFFIRLSDVPAAWYSAIRLIVAGACLAPLAWRSIAVHRSPGWRDLLIGLPAALPLAVHYWSWFIGVKLVSAATAALLVNVTPVLMPFLVWILMRERINRGEILGSVIAVAGVCTLAFLKDPNGRNTPFGLLLTSGSMCLCAVYLALGRRFARGRPIFAYLVPLYGIAGVLCLIIVALSGERWIPLNANQWLILAGGIVVPTVVGHTALNYAMVHLPSQVVSIANLGQFIFIALLAIPVLHEWPSWTILPPAALVLIGALIVIRSATPQVRQTIREAAPESASS